MKFLKKIPFFLLLLSLLSCAQTKIDPIDRDVNLTNQEFENALIKNHKEEKYKQIEKLRAEAPIPSVSRLINTPPPPTIGGDKTVSFYVTDDVPLKDVLIQLGRAAKIDVDLDPGISGGIVINAKNRPLKEIIDRIATLGKLRYTYQNGVLHFERDMPYLKNYFVDFLAGSQIWTDVDNNIKSIINNNASTTPAFNADSSFDSSPTIPAIPASSYTMNKNAGIIAIFATQTQHEDISRYLDDVYRVTSAQVLIEAKVVEVALNKEFYAGIDWNWVEGDKSTALHNNVPDSVFSGAPAFEAVVPKVKLLGLGGNIDATIRALEKFGTTRAISSPRINAINNQKATLDFSEKLVYFTVSSSQSTTVSAATPAITGTLTVTKNEEPVGVQLTITPSINVRTNEVTLDIRPKLSINSGQTATDPSVNPTTGANLGNKIPIIKTRELSTIAKVQSGAVLVIGGLMTETANNDDIGVPFISRIPILGYLFKYSSKVNQVVETVVFIKATIVNNNTPPSKYDRDFHNKFTVDKKPFLN